MGETPQIFQNRMVVEVIGDLFNKPPTGVLQWIDDTLLYSETFEDYLTGLDKFLTRVEAVGLRLNIHKCNFIGTEAIWCGRRIGRDGWNYDPEYYNRLQRSPQPVFKHELAQDVYLANWLSPAIHGLSFARGPLEHAIGPYRDLRELKQRNEPVEWTPALEERWKELME